MKKIETNESLVTGVNAESKDELSSRDFLSLSPERRNKKLPSLRPMN